MSLNRATVALSNKTGRAQAATEVRSIPTLSLLLQAKAHLPMRHPDAETVGAIVVQMAVAQAMAAPMEMRARTPTALWPKVERMLQAARLTRMQLLPAIDASVKVVKMAARMEQQPMLPLLPTTRLWRHPPAMQAQVLIQARRVMALATMRRPLTPIIFHSPYKSPAMSRRSRLVGLCWASSLGGYFTGWKSDARVSARVVHVAC